MKNLRDRAIENGLIDEDGNIQGLGPERGLPFCPDCGDEFWTDEGALYCPCEGRGEGWDKPSLPDDELLAEVEAIRAHLYRGTPNTVRDPKHDVAVLLKALDRAVAHLPEGRG